MLDRLDDDNYRDNEEHDFYTNKGAYQAFYDECKYKVFNWFLTAFFSPKGAVFF